MINEHQNNLLFHYNSSIEAIFVPNSRIKDLNLRRGSDAGAHLCSASGDAFRQNNLWRGTAYTVIAALQSPS